MSPYKEMSFYTFFQKRPADNSDGITLAFLRRNAIAPEIRYPSLPFPALMKFLLRLWVLAVAVVARATTVVPPSFDELVASSELIFRGQVRAIEVSAEGPRQTIVTHVTFAIERTLRGDPRDTITLHFLGGTFGDRELVFAGSPKFTLGEQGYFFVENGRSRVCPLMRLGHGRYRLLAAPQNAGQITRDDFTPLRNVAEVALPLGERAELPGTADEGMSVVAFEAAISQQSSLTPRQLR